MRTIAAVTLTAPPSQNRLAVYCSPLSWSDLSARARSLRTLFTGGVNESEVLVLLLSRGLLTRPWCTQRRVKIRTLSNISCSSHYEAMPCMAGLLEIRQAMRKQKPIVLLELTGPGHSFSFDDAYAMLRDLENKLPPLNPWAIDELRKHLDAGETLVDLQQTVLSAIEIGRSSRVPHLNINGCVPRT